MQKNQVSSKKKKSVGRGSNAAHFTYNMRHVHHMHRTTAYLAPNPSGPPNQPTHGSISRAWLVRCGIRSPPAPRASRRWERRHGTAKNAISLSRQASLVPSDPGPGVLPAPRVPPVGEGIAGPCPPLVAASNRVFHCRFEDRSHLSGRDRYEHTGLSASP